MYDCFNRSCPFRINETSGLNRCECTACPNRCNGETLIVSTHTLTENELKEFIKREFDTQAR